MNVLIIESPQQNRIQRTKKVVAYLLILFWIDVSYAAYNDNERQLIDLYSAFAFKPGKLYCIFCCDRIRLIKLHCKLTNGILQTVGVNYLAAFQPSSGNSSMCT